MRAKVCGMEKIYNTAQINYAMQRLKLFYFNIAVAQLMLRF